MTRIGFSLTFCAAVDFGADRRQQQILLRLDRLQRIGQKDLQPLALRQRMALVGEDIATASGGRWCRAQ